MKNFSGVISRICFETFWISRSFKKRGGYFTRRFLTVHLLFRTTRTITCESGVTLILFSPFVSIVLANNAP